jgi:L-amino acid N-acyltransferase YncA
MATKVQASKIGTAEDLPELPGDLSFFVPLIRHEVKETLESGGETYVSRDPGGAVNGVFIYDGYEATGTVFTKSRDVFDFFYKMKPSSYIFSELEAGDLQKETWNIWELDVEKAQTEHVFKYRVAIVNDAAAIERFMSIAQPETNKAWIRVALRNGDKCFVVKVAGRIVGIAWMSIVGDVARSHGLFVVPWFRNKGMMLDNYYARLIYLKARRVRRLVNEIAEDNTASVGLANREGEKVAGKIFLYTSPDEETQPKPSA